MDEDIKHVFHRSAENSYYGLTYFSSKNKSFSFRHIFVLFCLQFYCKILRMLWPLHGWMFIGLPKYSSCQFQIKVIHVFQIRWERDAVCEAKMTKGCVDWVFRSLSLLTGGHEEWVWGHSRWLTHLCHCDKEILFQRTLVVEGILTTWNACQGSWRLELHFISQAIACHSFSFPYPSYLLSPVWLSDLLSTFWCLCSHQEEK